jgi:hypothetical protein
MPLIYYKCECGHGYSKFYRQAKEAPAIFGCQECPKQAKRQLKAPNSTSKVVMDNGFQARAVEINPDIVEINEARSNKDYKED